jgi:hypothetical protein
MPNEAFETWAIVELFGHTTVAGKVTEQTIAGHGFVRVDVPQADGTFYTRCFGGAAIYGFNPCEEVTARKYAARLSPPLNPYVALPPPAPATEPVQVEAFGAGERARDREEEDDEFREIE